MSNHFFDAIMSAVAEDSPFMIARGDSWTYQDLFAGSARLARRLEAQGIQPGDRVLVQVDKSPEAVLLYLACIRAGAVYVPLNPAYTLAELDYFMRDAEPRVVIVDPARIEAVSALAGAASATVLTLSAAATGTLMEGLAVDAESAHEPAPRAPDDLAALVYTSGTTGRSKGAMITHDNLMSNAATLRDYWRFTASDRLIHALPIFHVHGLFVAINVTLLAGSSMLLLPKFEPEEVIALMGSATAIMGVPTFYVKLLDSPALEQADLSGMRVFISGSAPLLAETHKAFEARTGHAILERYGMTETGMNSSNPYDGERIAGTVGFPLPGISIRVTDPASGAPLPTGEIGMIEIAGPNVFKGYWRMPDKTEEDFRADGYFISGDLGRFDERGYLSIVGRNKDLVITGGYNVYPKEIESEIDEISGVVESAVIGIPHPEWGEAVTAIVVTDTQGLLSEDDIVAALAGRLARYKQPKRVLFVDELPRNTMGKVQKNVLRETYAELYATG